MGCGVPYQHPLMGVLWGVLISRAVAPACASLQSRITTTAPSPSLSHRGSVFPAGVSPGLWWGCKPGVAAVGVTVLPSHTEDMARLEEPLEAAWETGSWQPP